MKRESNEIVAAQKALDGVWGVDINPFAVAIARFRLIVAAVAGVRDQAVEGRPRLEDPPGDRRQPALRQPLESERREGSGANMVRYGRRKLGSRDLCRARTRRLSRRCSASSITSWSAIRRTSR